MSISSNFRIFCTNTTPISFRNYNPGCSNEFNPQSIICNVAIQRTDWDRKMLNYIGGKCILQNFI